MRLSIAVSLVALAFASPLAAQAAPPDLTESMPLPGRWSWTPTADGSEATFFDTAGRAQLWLHCLRGARTVTVARPASGVAPYLMVWTSSANRNLLASYNPATARVTAQLSAADPLLDALAFSRGRIGAGVSGTPPLVAPAWPEIARVVEDCRA